MGLFVLFNLFEALQGESFCCFLVGIILNGGTAGFGDTLVQLSQLAVCGISLSGCMWRGAVGPSQGRLVQASYETKQCELGPPSIMFSTAPTKHRGS